MKHIMQFRYYGKNNEKNYPDMGTRNFYDVLLKGSLFDSYGKVSKLGIQARPGTSFYLNNSKNIIEIGDTGIYELDFGNIGFITSLRFTSKSLEMEANDRIFIDIVYEGVGKTL